MFEHYAVFRTAPCRTTVSSVSDQCTPTGRASTSKEALSSPAQSKSRKGIRRPALFPSLDDPRSLKRSGRPVLEKKGLAASSLNRLIGAHRQIEKRTHGIRPSPPPLPWEPQIALQRPCPAYLKVCALRQVLSKSHTLRMNHST